VDSTSGVSEFVAALALGVSSASSDKTAVSFKKSERADLT
jgi:hypothetical protein